MRPDQHPLAVRLGGERADQVGRQIGVDLERGGAGAARAGDGEREVGARVDRLRPGRLARPRSRR